MQQGVRIPPTVPFYSWPSASFTSQPKSVRLLKMACIFCLRESLSPTGVAVPLALTPQSEAAQRVLWLLQSLFLSFIACFMPGMLNLWELSLGIIDVSVFLYFNACDCWAREAHAICPPSKQRLCRINKNRLFICCRSLIANNCKTKYYFIAK